ncbi:unnamed protein product [Symbiodinium natans]|uniref:Uncharacterized protein n=1 Tax=Symbiodinium natans TaxID=878477 RepID=A0A812L8D8_9DINO|nr:unnamed protein product [Symbiodinium natans]
MAGVREEVSVFCTPGTWNHICNGKADNSELGAFGIFDGGVSDLEETSEAEDWMDAVAREYRERCERNREVPQARQEAPAGKAPTNPFERLFRAREAGSDSRKRPRVQSLPKRRHSCSDTEKGLADRRAADEDRLEAFRRRVAAQPPKSCEELPWPSGPPDNPVHLHSKMPKELLLSTLREALRRWHPDKVLAQLAQALPPVEKEKAAQRATALAQQLTATKAAFAAHLCAVAVGD